MDVEQKVPPALTENAGYEGACMAFASKVMAAEQRRADEPVQACRDKFLEEKKECMGQATGIVEQQMCDQKFYMNVDNCMYDAWYKKYEDVAKECEERDHRGCYRRKE